MSCHCHCRLCDDVPTPTTVRQVNLKLNELRDLVMLMRLELDDLKHANHEEA